MPGFAHRRHYDPLTEQPALFRTFAETAPTEDGILAFANKWGGLGVWERVSAPAELAARQAEPFAFWRCALSEMRQAVWVWNTLTSEDREEQLTLRRHVKWRRDAAGHTAVVFDSHPSLQPGQTIGDDGYARIVEVIATDQFDKEGLAQFQEGELSQPARHFLCRLVNRNLQGRASPRVFPDAFKVMRGDRLPVLTSLRLVPASLYACLWLQLAQAMSTNKEQRRCRGCGEWFDLKAKGKRSDRTCCSDTCRKRVYLERREHARRLHAEGKTLKEIAKEIGAEVALVKKWVAKTKG